MSDNLVFGVGIYKKGAYKSRVDGKPIRAYTIWNKMFYRCYSEKYHRDKPSYIGCSVSNEWLEYQKFAEWYYKNYYEIPNEHTHLDKDILKQGNKIYSPDNCIFVPQSINSLFVTGNQKNRTQNNLPQGVTKYSNSYKAQCSVKGKTTPLGSYKTARQAFDVYTAFKKNIILEEITRYQTLIPKLVYTKIYDALLNYRIDGEGGALI